ncbi:hypothetical protein EYF80_045053 [Liparis tanakae]|uniref:Uncharacterized protein n=1 Tax=Liparis tanakae TaxID=230148 RepID=A0A4Z2FVC5_9TELE|nr:hypothetical protein EYF80_045053 [Liparis tanakae]
MVNSTEVVSGSGGWPLCGADRCGHGEGAEAPAAVDTLSFPPHSYVRQRSSLGATSPPSCCEDDEEPAQRHDSCGVSPCRITPRNRNWLLDLNALGKGKGPTSSRAGDMGHVARRLKDLTPERFTQRALGESRTHNINLSWLPAIYTISSVERHSDPSAWRTQSFHPHVQAELFLTHPVMG